MGPQVAIDLGRIERNARAIVERCAESGIKVFGVTKGTCGMPQVARAMLRGGVAGIAESRFENIRRLHESGIDCPIMLLRSPPMAPSIISIRSPLGSSFFATNAGSPSPASSTSQPCGTRTLVE